MTAAKKLDRCPQEQFDVIIGEHTLADAGRHLSKYLDRYSKDIHSVGPAVRLRHSIPDSEDDYQETTSSFKHQRPRVGDDSWEKFNCDYQFKLPKRIESAGPGMARPERLNCREIVHGLLFTFCLTVVVFYVLFVVL